MRRDSRLVQSGASFSRMLWGMSSGFHQPVADTSTLPLTWRCTCMQSSNVDEKPDWYNYHSKPR